MNNTITLNQGTNLFRYDIEKPPVSFTTEYNNSEYVFGDRKKNMAGLFFFFIDEKLRDDVARIAAGSRESVQVYYTRCILEKDVTLIDLREYNGITNMIMHLEEMNIDIFTDNFHQYNLDGSRKSLGILRSTIDSLKTVKGEENIAKRYELINNIYKDFRPYFGLNENVNYFGQLLTDFENGYSFKSIVSNLGIDGYCWDENRGHVNNETICLFDSTYLSAPITETIVLSD